MSGTSLDGLDLCYVKFPNDDPTQFEILHTETVPYNSELIERLRELKYKSASELITVNAELGILFGETINRFMAKNNIQQVDAIASHGQTIFHDPGISITVQIGHPAQIYAITGIKTIADFRSVDVALGGQGAPLVPIGDKVLFSDYECCLNLGGIANVSMDENGKRIAFDIVVCNMALNYLAVQDGQTYDEGGAIARKGRVQKTLLHTLNHQPFFSQTGPKSLGVEQFDEWYIPILARKEHQIPDLMATLIEHMGQQIGNTIRGKCLVTGGGAYNTALMDAIRKHTKAQIILPDQQMIDFKEALIFAFLGYLRLTNQTNTLASVTGASKDSIGGCIYG